MVHYNMRLATALRLRHGTHVALLQTGGDSYMVARDGRAGRAHDNRAPLVRLLQSEPHACKNKVVFTSHPPNHAEKGMARVCGVRTVGYLQGPTERWHDMRRSGYDDVPQTGTTLGYRDWFNRPQLERGHIERWLKSQNVGYQWAEDHRSLTGAGAPGADEARLLTDLGDAQGATFDRTARDAIGTLLAFGVVEAVHGSARSRGSRGVGYYGPNVGAVLVDGGGRLLAWGVNANVSNMTLHSEVNLIQFFQGTTGGAQLPASSTLYTTLEPCEMCSGMLHVATPGNFRVICGQIDPNLGWTALRNGARGGMLKTPRGEILPGVTWADLLSARLGGGEAFASRFPETHPTTEPVGDAHRLLRLMGASYKAGPELHAWQATLDHFLARVRGAKGG